MRQAFIFQSGFAYRRVALAIATVYAMAGALWITFSDRFVAGLGLGEAGLLKAQQFKGLAYVSVTAGLLLVLLWLVLKRLATAMDHLRQSRDDLKTTNRPYRMLRANATGSGDGLDPVVGLSGSAELMRRIGYAIGHANRHRGQVGLLVLDIDGFRDINENFGREAGDRVLKAVADTLNGCTGPGDSVHRLGSDEFGVLLGGLSRPGRPGAALDCLASGFPLAVKLSRTEIPVTVSIGVAFYPKDASDAEELLGRAELALHRRASRASGALSYYDPELDKRSRKQHDLAFALRSPDYMEGFYVHWQPLVESASGEMVAAEALLRWNHPLRGEIPPFEFIPILEDIGRIHAVGDFVLKQAIALGDARAAGGQALDIHVNVSLLQLQDPEFVERLTALWQAGAKAREWVLVLEITESQLMSDVERVSVACGRLRALGHRIELDDFGTGYSSLNYLTSLPIDGIKLDRPFIVSAEQDERTCKVVESVIALARRLGLATVAEGIETRAQSELLARLGCEVMQGYLFGRPMPASALPVPGQPERNRFAASAP